MWKMQNSLVFFPPLYLYNGLKKTKQKQNMKYVYSMLQLKDFHFCHEIFSHQQNLLLFISLIDNFLPFTLIFLLMVFLISFLYLLYLYMHFPFLYLFSYIFLFFLLFLDIFFLYKYFFRLFAVVNRLT